MSRRSVWSLFLAAAIVMTIILSIHSHMTVAVTDSTTEDDTASSDPLKQDPGNVGHYVIRRNYDLVKDGSSYEEVARILGPGTELVRSSLNGSTDVEYEWTGYQGQGRMTATFMDGKLVLKTESGLK